MHCRCLVSDRQQQEREAASNCRIVTIFLSHPITGSPFYSSIDRVVVGLPKSSWFALMFLVSSLPSALFYSILLQQPMSVSITVVTSTCPQALLNIAHVQNKSEMYQISPLFSNSFSKMCL